MGWQKSLLSLGLPAITLYPALVIFFVPPQLPLQSYPESQVSLKFPPTDERGSPSRTEGGGTRGPSCTQQGEMPLTVLMPSNNMGTTVAANPTFFWYVPKTPVKSAEFVVFDDKENEVYKTTFALSGAAGIVQLSLPATVSLEIGKNYMWQLALICDPVDRSKDRSIRGFSRRTKLTPALKTKLEQAAPLEQAKLYAQAKIWHETLTTLAQLRSSRPAEWEELLKSVGLEAIAQAPFVKCCTADNHQAQSKLSLAPYHCSISSGKLLNCTQPRSNLGAVRCG